MKIYVASSWRNPHQPRLVNLFRRQGYETYGFRNPEIGDNGFHWSEIDPKWQSWTPAQYRKALSEDLPEVGFQKDFEAMHWAEVFVLVLPSGRSSHLELGWAIGAGKPSYIYMPEAIEPELMHKMASGICISEVEIIRALDGIETLFS